MNEKHKIWLVLIPAMTLPFIASLFYFVFFSEYSFSRLIYIGTKIFTLVWPVIAYKLILKFILPKVSFDFQNNKMNILIGTTAGIIIISMMLLLMNTGLGNVVEGSADAIKIKVQQLGIINCYWTFGLFLSIIHSLIEEYYWRWFVYGNLNKIFNNYIAHALAGISFSAHHIVIASQYFSIYWGFVFGLLVGIGGIIFSILYQKQKTLLGAWMCHIVVDLGIISIGYQLIFA